MPSQSDCEHNSFSKPEPVYQLRYLHYGVVKHALSRPSDTAIISPGRTISFSELACHSQHFSQALIGVCEGVGLTAVLMEKDWQQVAACMGILLSGGGYVPLSIQWPAQRLLDVLRAVEAKQVLCTPSIKSRFEYVDGFNQYQWISLEQLPGCDCPPLLTDTTGNALSHIAYVIFTSGSTGVPKGVVISHGSAVNTVWSVNDHFCIGPGDAVLGLSALSFDLSVYDMFGVVGAGGSLVLPDSDRQNDPEHWADLILSYNISVWNSVPMFMSMLVTYLNTAAIAKTTVFVSVRLILLSGDWIPITLIEGIRRFFPNARIISLGGATEASVWSIWHEIVEVDPQLTTIPYGVAMPNQSIHILDNQLNSCSAPSVGQICIGGVGVAQGYWKDEQRTMDQFFIHPVSGERLYRTGDLGRLLPNGEVEFLGREDTQIKLGGHRIELGEIEAIAGRQSSVKQCVAVGYPEHNAIHLYVAPQMPDAQTLSQVTADQHSTTRWQEVYDQIYRSIESCEDETFNTVGWISQIDQKPFSSEEMREWVDQTVARIRHYRPRRILEVGCGTGLLLFRLAFDCETYRGIDISAESIEYIRRVKHGKPTLDHVELVHCGADEFEKIGAAQFDTIIINSVVCYFRDEDYLRDIIDYYMEHFLVDGGTIYIGDIPNYDLDRAFYATLLTQQNCGSTHNHVSTMLYDTMLWEKELHLSPRFFQQLPRHILAISAVQCMAKIGCKATQMNQFRFDVVLHKHAEVMIRPSKYVNYTDIGSLQAIAIQLQANKSSIAVQNIPNRLMISANQTLDRISGVNETVQQRAHPLLMTDLQALAEMLDYRVSVLLQPGSQRGDVDAVFIPTSDPSAKETPVVLPAVSDNESLPLSNSAARRIGEHIHVTLLAALKRHLPDYMVPHRIVFIEGFPLSQNGKIDRKQLPFLSSGSARDRQSYIAPRNALEKTLVALFAEVLHKRADTVGIHDDFFELGGDSLSTVNLVALAWQHGLSINFQQVQLSPTVAGISAFVANFHPQKSQAQRRQVLPQRLPLLPNQEPYTFIQASSVITYLLAPIELLIPEKIESVLQQLAARHESLRLYFEQQDGHWLQRVFPYKRELILHVHHLDGDLSPQQRIKLIKKHCDELTSSIDIEHQSLGFRAGLFQWRENQRFFLAIDHYCMDQLSMSLFWREFELAYHGRPLPPLQNSYRAVVDQLFKLRDQWDWREESQFWCEQLAKVQTVPAQLQHSQSESGVGMTERSVDIAEPWLSTFLSSANVNTDISVHNLLLTAWVQTLSNWLDKRGVVLILGCHNRGLVQTMLQTMGCFITSYPLYFDSNSQLSAIDAIASTNRTLQNIPHNGTRYALLQNEPQWHEQIYQYPQPFLGFNYLGEEELVSGVWQTTQDTIDHQQIVVSHGTQQNERYKSINNIPFLVMLSKINRASRTLTFTAEYAANCYTADTVDQILHAYRQRSASLWSDLTQLGKFSNNA